MQSKRMCTRPHNYVAGHQCMAKYTKVDGEDSVEWLCSAAGSSDPDTWTINGTYEWQFRTPPCQTFV